MRKWFFTLATVAALGFATGPVVAKERMQIVTKALIVQICGGDLHPAGCNWCNAIRCYVVEGCKSKTCTVLSFREIADGSANPKGALTQSSGLLDNNMAAGSPGGPAPVGTPVVLPGRAR